MDCENILACEKSNVLRHADRAPSPFSFVNDARLLCDVSTGGLMFSMLPREGFGWVEPERPTRSREAVAGNEMGRVLDRVESSVPEEYEGLLVVEARFIRQLPQSNTCP
jgi:hypothetical protein